VHGRNYSKYSIPQDAFYLIKVPEPKYFSEPGWKKLTISSFSRRKLEFQTVAWMEKDIFFTKPIFAPAIPRRIHPLA